MRVIARQPEFLTALTCGVVAYLLMNFLMTAYGVQLCGYLKAANLGVQWHVIAMYAPSFFTGRLIVQFGAKKIVMAGLGLTAFSIAVGLLGVDVGHFWLTLILLGVGWNFGFVGASTLVLECHHPDEKAKVQSFNDFCFVWVRCLRFFAFRWFVNNLWLEYGTLACVSASYIGCFITGAFGAKAAYSC